MKYAGEELEHFRDAHVWKRYVARACRPFVRGKVLEVGAGIGGTTPFFDGDRVEQLVCLEPDPEHVAELRQRAGRGELGRAVRVVAGTIDDLGDERFDTILYVDVLEHIESDREELASAAQRLSPGGHLVVMSPAHAWLYSPFDRKIGHHRRYVRATLRAIAPPDLERVCERYLDAAGLLASLANRFVVRRSDPTPAAIAFWDRVLVRVSSRIDGVLGHRVGKSILVVWRRSP